MFTETAASGRTIWVWAIETLGVYPAGNEYELRVSTEPTILKAGRHYVIAANQYAAIDDIKTRF